MRKLKRGVCREGGPLERLWRVLYIRESSFEEAVKEGRGGGVGGGGGKI